MCLSRERRESIDRVDLDSYPSKTLSISSSPPVQRYSLSRNRQETLSEIHPGESTDEKSAHRISFENFRQISSEKLSSRSKSIFSGLNSSLSTNVHSNRNLSRKSSRLSRKTSNRHPPLCRIDRHRRKALKLLIIIIVEFFLCWTPLFLYHTLGTFSKTFYRRTPSFLLDLILLFSFASALTNPLTYYFMSKRYRAVLFSYLTCFRSKRNAEKHRIEKNHEAMQIVKALRLHQQQNSFEYKQKNPLNSQTNKTRSNTFQ